MRIAKAVKRAPELGLLLLRDPVQVRHVKQWWMGLRSTPIESKIPWLPFRIIDLLDAHLTPNAKVFEFGGGGSTLWFAERAGEVVTVEHDPEWFPVLQRAVEDSPNVTVLHGADANEYAAYVNSINEYPDGHFDVVVVDGRQRVRCIAQAIPKVKTGGLLILDDTNRERYRPAFDMLEDWPYRTYRGLTPSKSEAGVTTVWRKP